MMGRLLGAVLVVAMIAGCGGAPATDPDGGGRNAATVRIAAASDLKFALDEIKTALADEVPDLSLAVTFGSSGTFFQQISNGAPFDMFLSADLSYPDRLVEAGLAKEADVFRYAVGRLAVWVPNSSPVDISNGLAALDDSRVRKVAIANPEHAPYGKAAVAAMVTAGVYQAVEDRLVLGENVAQAAEFAASGNADASVIALSLAVSPQLSGQGRYREVPLDAFPRLDQGGVVLAGARDRSAALRVRDFIVGSDGAAILKRHGFFLPGE